MTQRLCPSSSSVSLFIFQLYKTWLKLTIFFSLYFSPNLHVVEFCVCLADMEIVVMYSGKVQKWNKYTMKQDRNFVVTNLNVYNFKGKSNYSFL